MLAEIKLAQGDPVAAQSLLEQVPLDYSPDIWIWDTRFKTALYLRDYDAANRMIAATPANWAVVFDGQPPESSADGQVARARGDKQKALAVFAAARKNIGTRRGRTRSRSGIVMSRKSRDLMPGLAEKKRRFARHFARSDLMPIAKDSDNGSVMVVNLALVYAWTGERDRALEQLEKVATIPRTGRHTAISS